MEGSVPSEEEMRVSHTTGVFETMKMGQIIKGKAGKGPGGQPRRKHWPAAHQTGDGNGKLARRKTAEWRPRMQDVPEMKGVERDSLAD